MLRSIRKIKQTWFVFVLLTVPVLAAAAGFMIWLDCEKTQR
jgi:hypothetical protein